MRFDDRNYWVLPHIPPHSVTYVTLFETSKPVTLAYLEPCRNARIEISLVSRNENVVFVIYDICPLWVS